MSMRSPRYHLIIDIGSCQDASLTNREGLEAFLKALIDAIGMNVLAGPVVAEGIPENPGLSGFCIIDYSHVSIHTFTKTVDAMVDIFSCKPFDRAKAREMALAYFGTEESMVRSQEIWWD